MDNKVACVFLHITNHEGDNYQKDDFLLLML
jgi:hypothetical protein